MLKKELSTYDANKKDLISKALGKYVLIKDDKIIGIYETSNDAIAEAYKMFGNVPFLVKEIVEIDNPVEIVSNLLAI